MSQSQPAIVCFGEVLWDLLPAGKLAGGAPMNVAYHANNFGLKSKMISRIGNDDLGRELIGFLKNKKIPTGLIQLDHTFQTGIVEVTLDEKGSPSYVIVQPAAWDYIHPDEEAQKAVKKSDALVFGSLACRSERTKKTLLELIDLAPKCVFDVNLRPPFYSRDLLDELLSKADLVKMNDEELEIIAEWIGAGGNEEAKMNTLKNHYNLQGLIVTKGANGAVFLNEHGLFSHPGLPVKVKDTVGSGDAFFGGFLSQFMSGQPVDACLEFACAAGAYVATKEGATPDISGKIISEFIKQRTDEN